MFFDDCDGGESFPGRPCSDQRRRAMPGWRGLYAESSVIQGCSMGGYGAAAISAKYPELFSVCVIFDGALHDWQSLSKRRKAVASEIFGNSERHYKRFSPWKDARLDADRIRDRVSYRMVVGSLREFNRNYRQHLEGLGLSVDYVEKGCDHNLVCDEGDESVELRIHCRKIRPFHCVRVNSSILLGYTWPTKKGGCR